MRSAFTLVHDGDRAVELHQIGGHRLLRYTYRPETALAEATRPYAHPVCTLSGEVLTNFRPNDHPWHHGLSFTINSISGHNFWGGPTYRKTGGYQLRDNHGTQHHVGWIELDTDRWVQTLDWRIGADGERLLQEERTLSFALIAPTVWTLHWQATLENISGRELQLAQYFSNQELAGSHYTGLQFRGARDLLDEHGDPSITIRAAGGLEGEKIVHGAPAEWMEWHGRKDGSLRRVRLRFANNPGPLHWFVRRHNPIAAFPFHYARDVALPAGARLAVDHTLTFADE